MKQKKIERLMSFNKVDKKKYLEQEKLKASCDHKEHHHGEMRSTLKIVNEDELLYECSICHEKVSLKEVPVDVIRESVKMIVNAMELIKIAEDDISDTVLDQMGEMILFLDRLPKLYKNLVLERLKEEEECNGDMGYNGYAGGMQMMNPMFSPMNPMFYGGMYGGHKNGKKHKNKNKNKNKGYKVYNNRY